LSKSHVLAHHGGAVSQIILVISKYIDTSGNYMRCTQETARFATRHETLVLDCSRGVILPKKKCVYLGLSLSLSLSSIGRENERRGWGELDPSQVQPPNFHFWSTRPLSGAGSPACRSPSTFHYLPIHSMNPFARPPVCACATDGRPSCAANPCCRQDLPQIPYRITI